MGSLPPRRLSGAKVPLGTARRGCGELPQGDVALLGSLRC